MRVKSKNMEGDSNLLTIAPLIFIGKNYHIWKI